MRISGKAMAGSFIAAALCAGGLSFGHVVTADEAPSAARFSKQGVERAVLIGSSGMEVDLAYPTDDYQSVEVIPIVANQTTDNLAALHRLQQEAQSQTSVPINYLPPVEVPSTSEEPMRGPAQEPIFSSE